MRSPVGRVDADRVVLETIASPTNELELDYLKRRYRDEARQALEDSFAQLDARERNLLRQHYGLGLDVDELAAFYRVHRVTAWRWVARARESLVGRTREGIARRLVVASEEVSSILRVLQSQLEDGLRRLVATPTET
jgi:RNA polymerase sigma-70 factor (ECF subfamily)